MQNGLDCMSWNVLGYEGDLTGALSVTVKKEHTSLSAMKF
jgi:hypothetical protein